MVSLVEVSLAEEFLIENDIVGRPSQIRRDILACLACRASCTIADRLVYSLGIANCQDLQPQTVSNTLRSLDRAGVLETETVPQEGTGGGAKTVYHIAGTPLGQQFAEVIEPPRACPVDTVLE